MKKILFFLFFLIPCITFADKVDISTWEELAVAVQNAQEDDILSINSNLKANSKIDVDKKIVILGNGKVINLDFDYTGTLFNILSGGNLIFSDVVFDGENKWSWKSEDDKNDPYKSSTEYLNVGDKILSSVLITASGSLKFENSYIKNFYSTDEIYPIVKISGTIDDKVSFIMENSSVINCYGPFLSASYGNIEFNNNTTFSDNYGHGNKGGIFQLSNSEMIINNAVLKNNFGRARSGTIFGVVKNSLLIFNDGLIDNNIAKYHGSTSTGSVITLESGAGFTMNGGVIKNNVGTLSSVIASRWTNTADSGDLGVHLNGGTIMNNSTYVDTWNNASVFLRSGAIVGKDFVVDGNVVVNNTSASLTNNGIISNVVVNDSTAVVINNGEIRGDINITAGSFTNNGNINNVYETDSQIVNNGTIKGNYIRKLTPSATQKVVTIDTNGGKISNGGFSLLDILIDGNTVLELNKYVDGVEKRGHTFTGEWYIDNELTQKFDSSIMINDNVTLYAKYSVNKYKVIWKIDEIQKEELVAYGEKIPLIDTPKKDGFEFVKWDGYHDDLLMSDSNIEFVAVWKELESPPINEEIISEETIQSPNTGAFVNFISIIVILLCGIVLINLSKRKIYKI